MSARQIIGDKKTVTWRTWFKNTLGITQEYALMGYMISRHVAWFVVTVGMITAVPLIFEVKREAIVEELEQIQINNAIRDGATPSQLAQSGLTSAVDPKVLN